MVKFSFTRWKLIKSSKAFWQIHKEAWKDMSTLDKLYVAAILPSCTISLWHLAGFLSAVWPMFTGAIFFLMASYRRDARITNKLLDEVLDSNKDLCDFIEARTSANDWNEFTMRKEKINGGQIIH